MEFSELLAAFGKTLGLELSPDEGGACVLGVDDAMRVTIQNLDELDQIAVWAKIGDPPPQGLERLLSSMLEANHLFRGTGGATISRDDEKGGFYLCQCLESRIMDVSLFHEKVERFVNTLEAWQKLLVDYRPVSDSPSEGRQTDSAFPGPGFISV